MHREPCSPPVREPSGPAGCDTVVHRQRPLQVAHRHAANDGQQHAALEPLIVTSRSRRKWLTVSVISLVAVSICAATTQTHFAWELLLQDKTARPAGVRGVQLSRQSLYTDAALAQPYATWIDETQTTGKVRATTWGSYFTTTGTDTGTAVFNVDTQHNRPLVTPCLPLPQYFQHIQYVATCRCCKCVGTDGQTSLVAGRWSHCLPVTLLELKWACLAVRPQF